MFLSHFVVPILTGVSLFKASNRGHHRPLNCGSILYIIFYNIRSYLTTVFDMSFNYFYAGCIFNACQSYIKGS